MKQDNAVWSFLCSKLHLTPPTLFDDGLRWLNASATDEFVSLIIKLVYQALIYCIWKEINARIHAPLNSVASARTSQAVIFEIKQTVQGRLDPLSRAHNSRRRDITLLGTWMRSF
ncbi:unnamed protein product [Eruca vesicaria subsp. sativa]|uniref:Uncharacterized protein n=1 Tax=Eruca vesicaria subsp. sativa TaxID=29727 RepID=A0ABC8LJY4_ERUVS|nr:unnamed protein product [Eruca vesicaria subsp. sativa]